MHASLLIRGFGTDCAGNCNGDDDDRNHDHDETRWTEQKRSLRSTNTIHRWSLSAGKLICRIHHSGAFNLHLNGAASSRLVLVFVQIEDISIEYHG